MKKKIFALLLALTVLLSCNVWAAQEQAAAVQTDNAAAVQEQQAAAVQEQIAEAVQEQVTAAAEEAADPEMAGKIVILQTNDVHGTIEKYACVAQIRKDFEAEGAEVMLVDSGDFSQGNIYVSHDEGLSAVSLMNIAGYDLAVVGNHDFDFGYEKLSENLSYADFAVVCANVSDLDGRQLFDGSCMLTTSSGVKIGFLGLLTPFTQTLTNPAMVSDLRFGTEDIWELAEQQIEALSDADIVIVLSHLGVADDTRPYTSYDLWENVEGIDFILDGHSHTAMTEGTSGEAILSAGSNLTNVGVLVIDSETKTVEDHYLIPITDDSAKDPEAAAAAQEIIDAIDEDYQLVFAESKVTLTGYNDTPGNWGSETNSADLITDAMRWKILSSDIDLDVEDDHLLVVTNGGGIRADIEMGDVTKKNINALLPFGNTLYVIYISGAELLEVLEASTFCMPEPLGGFPQVSGIEFTLDTSKAYDAEAEPYPDSAYYGPATINRVSIDSVNGQPFSLTDTYAVVTNDFCANGGDSYFVFSNAVSKFDTGIALDEVVIEYIAEELGGVIGQEYAEAQGRITIY